MTVKRKTALIVVDVQKDFCEGGSLAVAGGNDVAKRIRTYIDKARKDHRYGAIVATKDWHLPHDDNGGHISDTPDFVTSWPPHCIQYTDGANLHPALEGFEFDSVFLKGQGEHGYSGFSGANEHNTSLSDYLWGIASHEQTLNIDIVGLAFDYCVAETAKDAVLDGFFPTILLDGTAGVSTMGSVKKALELAELSVSFGGGDLSG